MILSLDLMVLGIVTVIYCIFLAFIGIKIALTYFKVQDKVFIYAGITVTTIATTWSGVALFFISLVFFDITPPMEIYFLIHGALIPIGSITWILVILNLLEVAPRRQKWLKIIFITFWMSLEILYVLIIFTDTTLLGTLMDNKIQVDYAPFSELFLLIALAQNIITFSMLGIYYWKSDDRKIQLQGKIIIFAEIIFLFTAILEIFIPIIPIIVLARILVMFYSVLFYVGFIFPKWMEKLFLRE